VTIMIFLAIACIGSKRNFGIRYLLPVAPLAIVWISALGEKGRWPRRIAVIGLLGQATAIAMIHPYELTYFNALGGGPLGGHAILSDSNLDWGQGLKSLARLQRDDPRFCDLTLYYFGDSEADRYAVSGRSYTIRAEKPNPHLPPQLSAESRYLAVSVSLRWGPWAPPGYFRALESLEPVCFTDDCTIAIYQSRDVLAVIAAQTDEGHTAMIGGP
jgi:hypothetical protein